MERIPKRGMPGGMPRFFLRARTAPRIAGGRAEALQVLDRRMESGAKGFRRGPVRAASAQ